MKNVFCLFIQREEECRWPCNCPLRVLDCNYGVSQVRDGCGCCMMCARQSGDTCSQKNLCEPAKRLYCDIPMYSTVGVCRGKIWYIPAVGAY